MYKRQVTALTVNCDQLRKEDIARILEKVLYEFPVSQIQFFITRWVEMLPLEHELNCLLYTSRNTNVGSLFNSEFLALSGGFQDAYTYNARNEVFCNAQTGNVVLMSQHFMGVSILKTS